MERYIHAPATSLSTPPHPPPAPHLSPPHSLSLAPPALAPSLPRLPVRRRAPRAKQPRGTCQSGHASLRPLGLVVAVEDEREAGACLPNRRHCQRRVLAGGLARAARYLSLRAPGVRRPHSSSRSMALVETCSKLCLWRIRVKQRHHPCKPMVVMPGHPGRAHRARRTGGRHQGVFFFL